VVTRDIPAGKMAWGAPARVQRDRDPPPVDPELPPAQETAPP
jgi:acetyltransferase-like isoleucine patch superfamily enzyme